MPNRNLQIRVVGRTEDHHDFIPRCFIYGVIDEGVKFTRPEYAVEINGKPYNFYVSGPDGLCPSCLCCSKPKDADVDVHDIELQNFVFANIKEYTKGRIPTEVQEPYMFVPIMF